MTTSSPTLLRVSPGRNRLLRKIVLEVLAVFVVVAAVAGTWIYWRIHTPLPQLDGIIRLKGLAAKVEVLRDARGVPHLRASSLEDLAFAQGYVTAQDRLWQMDLSRRIAQGRLSELFGDRTLKTDIQNRTLGLSEVAERAAKEFDPQTQQLFVAYARGVNAYISTHQKRLPIEFALLHYHPEPWREADSLDVALNMAKTLNTTWPDDLMRERVRFKLHDAQLSADVFPSRSPLDHPVAEPLPGPRAPGPLPVSAAASKSPAHPLLRPPNLIMVPLHGSFSGLDSMLGALLAPSSFAGVGSNNWVVSGAHTYSGKPLLANDPHLGYSVPSVWYMIHLEAPGIDVSGVSLPGLPLVVIGRNQRIAWGMTNTSPDVQDLYDETFNPRNPQEYRYDAQWLQARVRTERIKVRGRLDYLLNVKVTRHGPVVLENGHRELALAWTALLPHALQFPFLKLDQAHNWKEFTEALRSFTGPMQNFVYADTDGNIGFYAAGWVPIRKLGDGSVPVPGSSDDYGWTGMIPFGDLPHAYNPLSGILATANGRIVPDGYPYFITAEWGPPYRTARIYQLLGSRRSLTVADMLKIQTDIHPLDDEWLRTRLLAAAREDAPAGNDARYALETLRRWDGVARADSAATLVCEQARQALLRRILEPRLGKNLDRYYWPMSAVFLQNVIDHNQARWLPPGDQDFNQTLIRSMEEAVSAIPQIVGSHNHRAWKWGNTIPLIFHHPLGGGSRWLGWLFNVGPFPQAGTKSTVKQTTPALGPSMRMVVDFSDFDRSVQNITLGESGQVSSPFYKDQFQAWYHGRSFSMLFSDEAVQKGAVHRLVLEPAGTN